MTVRDFRKYLEKFPADMEVIQRHRDSCYPIKEIDCIIYARDDWYMENGNIEGGETKLIVDVSY